MWSILLDWIAGQPHDLLPDVGTLTSLAAVAKEAGGIQTLRRQLDVLERLQLGGGTVDNG